MLDFPDLAVPFWMIQAQRSLDMTKRSRTRFHPLISNRFAVVVAYAFLALWATWPLAREPATTLPLGATQVTTVPLFNVWTIWWNADRLRHGFSHYWNAPIFHPATETFAFSEPQPTTILVAPIVWLTGSRVLAYNVYLWLSLVLNGVFAERLLRLLGNRRATAFGGGAAMLLLPLVHAQIEVLQLIPVWGILWTWMALIKTARRPSVARGAEAGAAFGVAFLSCAHQGLFLAVLIAGAVWTLPRWSLRLRGWLPWFVAAAVAAMLAGPVVVRFQHVMTNYDFKRTPDIVMRLSALPVDYASAAGRHWIGLSDLPARPGVCLSPGWIKTGLAVVGLVFGMGRRRWRRWTVFLLVTAGLAFLLSLGPNLNIGRWHPWWTLTGNVPGLSQVRNVFRFAFFVQMAAVVFASQGLYGLSLISRRFCVNSRCRFVATVLLTFLGLAGIFEVVPATPPLAVVPDRAANARWIGFVRDATLPGGAIACLPFAAGDRVDQFEVTARWMYFATFHQAPLVDGYSGFFPPEYFELRAALNLRPLSEDAFKRLAEAGVELVVVDRTANIAPALDQLQFNSFRLEHVFADSVGIDVYRLLRIGKR